EENYSGDDDEAELYQYEQEAYPIMRSGRNYIPRTSFARTPVVDELDRLQRNTAQNAQSPNNQNNIISSPTKKSKMTPAPIETLTEFNVADYLQNLSSGLTIGQAAHLSPKYRAGIQRAVKRSYTTEKEANLIESDEEESTTAAKVTLRIGGKAQVA